MCIRDRHNEAYQVINDNREVLDKLALALLEKETLDHNELADIFKDVKRLSPRPQWLSSGDRPVSTLPPVNVPRREQPAGVAASTEAEAQTQVQEQPRPSGQTRPATA